jgi:hypothetical protein
MLGERLQYLPVACQQLHAKPHGNRHELAVVGTAVAVSNQLEYALGIDFMLVAINSAWVSR